VRFFFIGPAVAVALSLSGCEGLKAALDPCDEMTGVQLQYCQREQHAYAAMRHHRSTAFYACKARAEQYGTAVDPGRYLQFADECMAGRGYERRETHGTVLTDSVYEPVDRAALLSSLGY
jgi:hypothetical protein